jgi:HlyD family secretion protein
MNTGLDDRMTNSPLSATNGHDLRIGFQRRRRQRMVFTVLGLLVVLGFIGLYVGIRQDKGLTHAAGAGIRVVRGDIVNSVDATGSVVAEIGAQVNVGSQVPGTLGRICVNEGQHVKAGQVVAEVSMPDIEAQYKQAVDTLRSNHNGVEQLRISDAVSQQTEEATLAASEATVAQQVSNQTQVHAAARYQMYQIRTARDKAVSEVKSALTAEQDAQENHDLDIAASQATLDSAVSQAKYADAQLVRNKGLFAEGYVAASSLDQAQAQADQADTAVTAARKNLAVVVNNADSELKSSHEQVQQARADLASAEQVGLQMAGQLAAARVSDSAMSAAVAQLDQARAALQNHAARLQGIEQAQSAANSQAQQVDYIADQLAKGVITSPINGTVAEISVHQGETVAAGLSVQTIMTIVDMHRLQVQAEVDETDVSSIALGQVADVTFDGIPDQVFHGRVVSIRSLPTTQSNVITYTALIILQNPPSQLRPGMTASVSIEVGKHSGVLLAPSDSIKEDGDTSVVGLYKPGSTTPVKTTVVTGAEDDTNTEIVSGLRDGDEIAGADWSPI